MAIVPGRRGSGLRSDCARGNKRTHKYKIGTWHIVSMAALNQTTSRTKSSEKWRDVCCLRLGNFMFYIRGSNCAEVFEIQCNDLIDRRNFRALE